MRSQALVTVKGFICSLEEDRGKQREGGEVWGEIERWSGRWSGEYGVKVWGEVAGGRVG